MGKPFGLKRWIYLITFFSSGLGVDAMAACEAPLKVPVKIKQSIDAKATYFFQKNVALVAGADILKLVENPTNQGAIEFLNKVFPKEEWVARQLGSGYDRLLKVDELSSEASARLRISNQVQWFDGTIDSGYINGPSRGGPSFLGLFEFVGFENVRGFSFQIGPQTKIQQIKFENSYFDSGSSHYLEGPMEAQNLSFRIESPDGRGYRELVLSLDPKYNQSMGVTLKASRRWWLPPSWLSVRR
jgi:hypothetical protein